MESPARINSSLMPRYINKHVRLVGNLIGLEGQRAILETTDKGQVVIHTCQVISVPALADEVGELLDSARSL